MTWAVDPGVVAAALPARFTPDVRDGRAFVSVVPFLDRSFRFRFAPWPRLSCGQVNHRTYVVDDDGTPGVWFFGTSLDSRLVGVPRRLWRMPWHRDHVRVRMDRVGYRADVTGSFGGLAVGLRRTGERLVAPPELVDPFVGWYPRTDGGVGRYSVWHEPLPLERAELVEGRVDLHDRLGLDADFAWAGVCETTTFDVHTPPTRA